MFFGEITVVNLVNFSGRVVSLYPKNNSNFSEAKRFCFYLLCNYRNFISSLY